VSYIASVKVGSQGSYDLLIDTGSSNTWIGAGKRYRPSSASGLFEVEYGSGSVFGYEVCPRLVDILKLRNVLMHLGWRIDDGLGNLRPGSCCAAPVARLGDLRGRF
jgi:hypothetical protein